MEQRLATALHRLGQADRALRDRGQDPEPFLLIYSANGPAAIKHPAWNNSWPLPTAEDIDDLEELRYVRTEPGGVKRTFSLTVSGRRQAYEELIAALDAVQERALELHAEAAPRLAAMPEEEREEHRTVMMLMHFHRAPAADPGAASGRQHRAGRPTATK